MCSQFVEYADVERPGVKLVSAKQVQIFPTDTSFGIVLYALIHAIAPSMITTPPQFQMKVTLGSTNPAEGRSHIRVSPSKCDYAFQTRITYPDGTEQDIGRSLDQSGIYPVKSMEGDIYFQITKTPTQRVLAANMEIIG